MRTHLSIGIRPSLARRAAGVVPRVRVRPMTLPCTFARRALVVLLSLATGLQPVGSAVLAAGLPDLGDESQAMLTPGAERKMGESVLRQIRGAGAYLEDPEVNDYLNLLGNRLVAASPEDGSSSSSSRSAIRPSTRSRCRAASSASTPA